MHIVAVGQAAKGFIFFEADPEKCFAVRREIVGDAWCEKAIGQEDSGFIIDIAPSGKAAAIGGAVGGGDASREGAASEIVAAA